MTHCIIWERPDGGVTVENPAFNDRSRPAGDTDEALIARCKEKTALRLAAKYGGGSVAHDHDVSQLPEPAGDRPFFNAWQWSSSPEQVFVDMPTARGIHMDKIRVARNAELATKDITFMRAVEDGDTSAQSTIATEKQTLRDIPQTFDLTTDTPTQLKALWPSELPAQE